MKIKKLNFFNIFFISLIVIIVQYLFLHEFYDHNNLLFSDYGDDYNYLNNFKFIENSTVQLVGLAQLGLITPYNYILYVIMSFGGVKTYWLIEFLLFVLSNYYFYKIALSCLNKFYAFLSLFVFLILPLRYIWLFGFYKDSILLSLSIIFVSHLYFKRRTFFALLLGLPIFLIRPLTLGILIISGQKVKLNFKVLFIVFISGLSLFYIFQEYIYFFRGERIDILTEKMNTLPFNSNGILTVLYLPFLWVLTLIQPIFTIYNSGEIWYNISPVVRADALLKLLLVPLVLKGLLYTKFYLKDEKISIIFKLLLSLSLPITVGFLFLTNRHVLIILPWQIIFGFYVLQTKKYSFSILLLFISMTVILNFLRL